MPLHVHIVENNMVLMNKDRDTYAHSTIAGYVAAKRQIRQWTSEFPIYIGEAYRTLDEHFSNPATK